MDTIVFPGPDGLWTPLYWMFQTQSKLAGIVRNMPSEARLFWNGEDCHYEAHVVNLDNVSTAMTRHLKAVEDRLEQLLLGHSAPVPPLDQIADDRTNGNRGFSFLTHPDNKEWAEAAGRLLIMKTMVSDETLRARWMRQGRPNQAQFEIYRREALSLQTMLLAAVHLMGGLPVRKSEMLTLRYFNTAAGGLRNIFIWKGYVVIRTVGDKTFWYRGERKVWRVLPQRLSRVVVTFIAVIAPFLETMELQWTEGNGKCPFLFSRRFCRLEPDLVSARDMTEAVKAALLRGLPNAMTVAAWRHVAIAFGRRYLTGELVDRLTAAADEDDDDTIDLMAGHTTRSAEMHYAREIDEGSKLDEFLALGFKWHRLWRLTSAKRELDDSDAEDGRPAWDRQQQERLEGLEHLLTDDEFRRMCRISDVQLRDHQRRVFETMAAGVDKFLYVAGTGAGKSVVFALPAYAMPSTMIVVVQPTRGLQRETLARLRSYGIKGMIFPPEEGEDEEVVPSVVLVTPEATAYSTWQAFLNRHHARRSIDRAVLDEAHEILINSDFRPRMAYYASIMNRISPRQIYMTGTLPPSMELRLKNRLELPADTPVVRSKCTSKNIRYEYIDAEPSTEVAAKLVSGLAGDEKGIVYVVDKAEGQRVSGELGLPFYSADVAPSEQERMIAEWKAKGGAMVATSALGVGVDFRGVVLVVCLSAFSGIEMLQMLGRAGRNGEPATGVLVMPLSRTRDFLRDYATSRCRRFAVSSFLDGEGVVCGLGDTRCDLCGAAAGARLGTTWITPEMKRFRIDTGSGGGVELPEPSPALVAGSRPADIFRAPATGGYQATTSAMRAQLAPAGTTTPTPWRQTTTSTTSTTTTPANQSSGGGSSSRPTPDGRWRDQLAADDAQAADNLRVLKALEEFARKLQSANVCVACYLDKQECTNHYVRKCPRAADSQAALHRFKRSLQSMGLPARVCWTCLFPQDWENEAPTSKNKTCVGAKFFTKEIGAWVIARHAETWRQVCQEMGAPMLPGGQALVEEGNETELLGRQEDEIRGWYKERVILPDGKVTANVILVLARTAERVGCFN